GQGRQVQGGNEQAEDEQETDQQQSPPTSTARSGRPEALVGCPGIVVVRHGVPRRCSSWYVERLLVLLTGCSGEEAHRCSARSGHSPVRWAWAIEKAECASARARLVCESYIYSARGRLTGWRGRTAAQGEDQRWRVRQGLLPSFPGTRTPTGSS